MSKRLAAAPPKLKIPRWRFLLQRIFRKRPKKPPLSEMTVFTRQFATLLAAGVPLTESCNCFYDEKNLIHQAMVDIGEKVNSGYRLSAAMRTHPHVFSPIYCGLIESGEATGRLVDVLLKQADDLEKQLKVHNRLSAALTYPAFLLLAAFGCVAFFLHSVLPLLEPLFTSMHIELPLITRILLQIKTLLPWLVLGSLGGAVLLYGLYLSMSKDPVRLRQMHRLVLLVPLFGPLFRTLTIARILQSMATMLDVGVVLLQAFRACESLSTNAYIRYQIETVRKIVMDGETMSVALGQTPLFPRAVVQLVSAGEETSDLIAMFKFSAHILTEDADLAIDQLAMAMEPMIMMIMGVVVGFILLAAMLPIVQLLQNL